MEIREKFLVECHKIAARLPVQERGVSTEKAAVELTPGMTYNLSIMDTFQYLYMDSKVL